MKCSFVKFVKCLKWLFKCLTLGVFMYSFYIQYNTKDDSGIKAFLLVIEFLLMLIYIFDMFRQHILWLMILLFINGGLVMYFMFERKTKIRKQNSNINYYILKDYLKIFSLDFFRAGQRNEYILALIRIFNYFKSMVITLLKFLLIFIQFMCRFIKISCQKEAIRKNQIKNKIE